MWRPGLDVDVPDAVVGQVPMKLGLDLMATGLDGNERFVLWIEIIRDERFLSPLTTSS